MNGPPLTVVLPVHNGLPFLDAALQSILRQKYSTFKMIAIDDGSTDGSAEYLDSVRDERVVVLHQARAGLGAVLNLGIDMCDTPFLARMDADDISLPHRFERQMAHLMRNPDLAAIGSPLTFLVHTQIQRGLAYPTKHDAIVRDLLRGESSLSHPTLLMRTAAARATRYRIAGAGEDLDFCLRLAEYGRVANLEASQYLYRLHETSLSMTKQGELECGYSYARLTALQRKHKVPETPLHTFVQNWNGRGLGSRIRSTVTSASARHYRSARLAWAERAYVQSAMHLATSLLLQPRKAARLSVRKMRSSEMSGTIPVIHDV